MENEPVTIPVMYEYTDIGTEIFYGDWNGNSMVGGDIKVSLDATLDSIFDLGDNGEILVVSNNVTREDTTSGRIEGTITCREIANNVSS